MGREIAKFLGWKEGRDRNLRGISNGQKRVPVNFIT
jgi:hypothetical protein